MASRAQWGVGATGGRTCWTGRHCRRRRASARWPSPAWPRCACGSATMPETPRRADYDVLDKWHTVSFDDLTRNVLQRRLHDTPPRRFFDDDTFALLEAACARLLATEPGRPPVAHWIDADLFE